MWFNELCEIEQCDRFNHFVGLVLVVREHAIGEAKLIFDGLAKRALLPIACYQNQKNRSSDSNEDCLVQLRLIFPFIVVKSSRISAILIATNINCFLLAA